MQKRILLVEDDVEINQLIEEHLKQENYDVYPVFDGAEALALFQKEQFDLVLLDLMLPKINGMELLKQIRESSTLPVLIISAKDSDIDKALGLGFGADDYLSKPFSRIELSARVQAAIRRATQYMQVTETTQAAPASISYKDLLLDMQSFSVNTKGKSIPLTSKEFHILKLLITNRNRVFTKEQIYQIVWEDNYYGNENVINVHIRRLREKIEEDPSNPQYLKTVWGIGYKLGD